MKKFIKHPKFLVLTDQAIFSSSSFMLTIFSARLLSLDDFGRYAGYLLGIYLAVSGISAFVVQPFQVIVGGISNQKTYTAFIVWFQALAVSLSLGLCVFATIIFQLELPLLLFLFSLGFLFHDFGRRVFLALNKIHQALLLDSLAAIGFATALFIFSRDSSKELSHLLLLLSFAYLLPLLYIIFTLKPLSFHTLFFKSALARHIQQGKWLFLSAMTQWWAGNLYVVASGLYLGTKALGALRLAQSLMGVLNVFIQAFENYVLPQTAHKLNTTMATGTLYLSHMSKKMGAIFIPIVLLIFLFAKQIFLLAGGEDYLAYVFVLRAYSVLYIFILASQPLRLLIRALLLNKHFFYGYIFSLLFALLLSHWLLSTLQLTGAVIGLGLSQLVLITYWSIILKHQNIQLWKLFTSS